ncbi:MAG TPA: EAL domain-containing protein [Actinomycetota bacterium]
MAPPGAATRRPRLILPFAIASLVLFVGIGVGLSQYVSRDFVVREQLAARYHAQFVATSILRDEINPGEMVFLTPMEGTQYADMNDFVHSRVLQWPIVRVKIWRVDGTVIYSDASGLVGRRFPVDADLQGAFDTGRPVSGITNLTDAENVSERGLANRLYETYVPIWPSVNEVGRPAAVVEVYQDYASIQGAAAQLTRTVFVVLTVGLGVLWLLLLPVMHRISRRVADQNSKLREGEAKHRAVVEQIPAITYTSRVAPDGASTPIFISPQIESLLGVTPDEWLTDHERWFEMMHPDDVARVRDEYQHARAIGEPFTSEYRMVASDGHVLWFRDEEVPIKDERGRVALVQGVMLDITDRKRAEEELAFLAYHDKLTGLPNRVMFEELLGLSIARARRHDLAVAVLYMDLDDFKLVNDSLGHAAGDELLQAVADRLREATRETDFVARQGGDEFLLLLADLERLREPAAREAADSPLLAAQSVASRVFDSLRSPFVVADTELYVSASIGISLYPSDAVDAGALLKNADAAMYRSKKAGPGNFTVYSTDGAGSVSKLSMATRLRKAVERQNWVLHYQPLVSLGTGELIGVESLLRWQDPRGGLIAPGEFIPLAEEMGLIEAIGDWVLAELCMQSRAWSRQGLDIQLGFNLSPRQVWQSDIALRILSRLESEHVAPQSVVVELTESAAMTDPDRTQRVLTDLHDRGVRLAIDDFGTGYSSLSRLKHLPVDILKIDRSFIRDTPSDRDAGSMVRAMIQLAHNLDMLALAEGIETEEQWRFLIDEGCELGQGFLFSRPVPAETIFERYGPGGSDARAATAGA